MDIPTSTLAQQALRPTELFVQETGSGTPLLLIHGLMVSGEMYRPALPGLAQHHHLIVPDLRGYGHSRALPGPYTVTQLADDLARLLDDLGIDTAVDVLGYSQGGAVAQQLAYARPDRVRGLVLACTYAYNMLSLREHMEGIALPWLIRILGLRRLAGMVSGAGGGARMSPEIERWFQGILTDNDQSRMVEASQAMTAFDSRPWLDQIVCPTLVIAGAEDTAVPLAHAQMLVQGIPGAQLRMVDGAGHTLLWTHTEVFTKLVNEFLASLSGS